MDVVLIVFAMIILLLLQGFFSGSEIALVNVDKIHMRAKASQGSRGAQLVLNLFKRPEVLLTTTLVGTNVSVVTLTALGTVLMIRWFGDVGELYSVMVFTPLLLIFGEVVPKSVYQQRADQFAPVVVYPLRAFKFIFYPIIFGFSLVARLAAKLAGQPISPQSLFITRQQLRTVVEMAERGANVDVFDQMRIKRAIRFANTTVGEAMVPIAEMVAIDQSAATRSAVELIRRHGFNRLPVYDGNVANIIGIVTLTVWELMEDALVSRPLAELVEAPLYVSPMQNIDELLPTLRERDDRMAVVVDEFGSAIGMITVEDILEEVVGEIEVGYEFDEYRPRRKRHYQRLGEDVYLMDSRVPISDVNDLLEIDLPATEFHTVGGFVETTLRRIPQVGESVVESGWRFSVAEATERAVVKLRVERV
ncbi:MAG: hypothetical protein AMJ69_02700 [Gammaproteobacteria bacterium SG8_47]|nr:MAG: hypothetical protein AMJ69_02700 [Gammaproteobacteria bacterium SG8_47]